MLACPAHGARASHACMRGRAPRAHRTCTPTRPWCAARMCMYVHVCPCACVLHLCQLLDQFSESSSYCDWAPLVIHVLGSDPLFPHHRSMPPCMERCFGNLASGGVPSYAPVPAVASNLASASECMHPRVTRGSGHRCSRGAAAMLLVENGAGGHRHMVCAVGHRAHH